MQFGIRRQPENGSAKIHKALHRSVFPLRPKAAGELCR